MSRHVLRNERRADRLATMEKKKSNSGGVIGAGEEKEYHCLNQQEKT